MKVVSPTNTRLIVFMGASWCGNKSVVAESVTLALISLRCLPSSTPNLILQDNGQSKPGPLEAGLCREYFPRERNINLALELIKRRVPQIAAIYIAATWGLAQFVDFVTLHVDIRQPA